MHVDFKDVKNVEIREFSVSGTYDGSPQRFLITIDQTDMCPHLQVETTELIRTSQSWDGTELPAEKPATIRATP